MPYRTVCALVSAATAFALAPEVANAAAADKCPGALDTPTEASTAAAADTVTCLVNAERAKRGLKAVTRDADLGQAARRHARDMVRRGYFSHVSPGGSTLGDRLRSPATDAARAGARARRSAGAPAAWRRRTRWSTNGSTARRIAGSCSMPDIANWGSGSRPASRATSSRACRARRSRSTSGRSAARRRRTRGPGAGGCADERSHHARRPLRRHLDGRPTQARPRPAPGDVRRLGGRGLARTRTRRADRQHEAFVTLLGDLGAEVELAGSLDGLVDAVYMHDPLIMTARGGIPLNMAKPIRSKEPGHAAEELRAARHPDRRHARRRRVRRRRRSLLARRPHDRARPRLPDQPRRRGSPARAAHARGRARGDLRHAARPGAGLRPAPAVVPLGGDRRAVRDLRAARARAPAAGHPRARDRLDRDRPRQLRRDGLQHPRRSARRGRHGRRGARRCATSSPSAASRCTRTTARTSRSRATAARPALLRRCCVGEHYALG